jgi:small subunit ribosomal protein S21
VHVVRREGESFEDFFARYKRGMNRSGILKDVKRHRFYLSPSESRRLKERQAARRRRRRARR